jgi:hypothetical protein
MAIKSFDGLSRLLLTTDSAFWDVFEPSLLIKESE